MPALSNNNSFLSTFNWPQAIDKLLLLEGNTPKKKKKKKEIDSSIFFPLMLISQMLTQCKKQRLFSLKSIWPLLELKIES